MIIKLILLVFIIFSEVIYLDAYSQETNTENKNKDTLSGTYIPLDLNDCFKHIDVLWVDSIKKKVLKMSENEFVSNAHFGFGMWIRNNWGLWGGSRLAKYFNNLGISHPDDMSGIILVSYYRHLKKQDIKLEEQIKYYKNFWEKSKQK